MEGFLSGFKLAPKPIKGVELICETHTIISLAGVKSVLAHLTTSRGLAGWLGEAPEFLAHVGTKFEITCGGATALAVITAFVIPSRVVLMVESLGEFDFSIAANQDGTILRVNVSRTTSPPETDAWRESTRVLISKLEKVVKNV